jgi:hypothetical protein
MRALRERARRGLRRLTIEVSEDDLREIARAGYEAAAVATLGVVYAMDFVLHRFPCLSKSIKYPLEEQDAQADDHQRDAGGGSYSQDLGHPYLRLDAPTP